MPKNRSSVAAVVPEVLLEAEERNGWLELFELRDVVLVIFYLVIEPKDFNDIPFCCSVTVG